MAPRRFDTSRDRHNNARDRLKKQRRRSAADTSPLLLAAIGAVVGAAVVMLVSGRLSRHDRRPTPRTDRQPSAPHNLIPAPRVNVEVESGLQAATPEALEERVLEVFNNDVILSQRPIDIGATDDGRIELSGSVRTKREVTYAVTLARGVPAVAGVVDELVVRPLV